MTLATFTQRKHDVELLKTFQPSSNYGAAVKGIVGLKSLLIVQHEHDFLIWKLCVNPRNQDNAPTSDVSQLVSFLSLRIPILPILPARPRALHRCRLPSASSTWTSLSLSPPLLEDKGSNFDAINIDIDSHGTPLQP